MFWINCLWNYLTTTNATSIASNFFISYSFEFLSLKKRKKFLKILVGHREIGIEDLGQMIEDVISLKIWCRVEFEDILPQEKLFGYESLG